LKNRNKNKKKIKKKNKYKEREREREREREGEGKTKMEKKTKENRFLSPISLVSLLSSDTCEPAEKHMRNKNIDRGRFV